MSKFIWVRDRDKRQHFINVNYIIRITHVPAIAQSTSYSYMILQGGKEIFLANDTYDTYDDIVVKINQVES